MANRQCVEKNNALGESVKLDGTLSGPPPPDVSFGALHYVLGASSASTPCYHTLHEHRLVTQQAQRNSNITHKGLIVTTCAHQIPESCIISNRS